MKKRKGKLLVGLIAAAMVGSLVFLVIQPDPENSGEVSKEFTISNLVFCSEESKSYMNYRLQPGATYVPGDTVWIYMNLEGLKLKPNFDGTSKMWIIVDLTLKAPDGDILSEEEALEGRANVISDPNQMCFDVHLDTTSQFTEGEYTVEIVVTDKLGNRTASTSGCFILIGQSPLQPT